MGSDPFIGDIQRLTNERAAFRRRVGDWRIFFDLDPERQVVDVSSIERRTTTTYRRR
jgi:mRNA-degrading endonuclease RelE of RelBE toxin-antitoxin system